MGLRLIVGAVELPREFEHGCPSLASDASKVARDGEDRRRLSGEDMSGEDALPTRRAQSMMFTGGEMRRLATMRTIHALFDGEVLRPEERVPLAPNTRVTITLEDDEAVPPGKRSFIETARSVTVEGPADWSSRLHDYLYGGRIAADD